MVKLHRDDKEGVYGLASFELADGPAWTPQIKDTYKPKTIDRNGTKVTLLGMSEESNASFPDDAGGGMNWLITYLTGRYFQVPTTSKFRFVCSPRTRMSGRPRNPSPSAKTFNFQNVNG